MRVVVTGAAGYLGSRLCAHLRASHDVEHDVEIVAVSRREAPWVSADEHVVADVTTSNLAPLLAGAAAVVHLAGANEVAAAGDPDGTTCAAIAAARRVAESAPAGCRIVHLSTVHVYGAAMAFGGVVDETTLPAPRHPYALARLASEYVLGARDPVVLRLTNSVGAPVDRHVDRWTLVANDLCRQAAATGRVVLRTHGMQWRDFVHQADACRIIAAALDPARVPAGTYNLGFGSSLTVRGLAALVQDAFERQTGHRPELDAPAPPDESPPLLTVDVGRLAALGLRAERSVADAIDETARFCLDLQEAAVGG